jgi:CHAT domain-containing protein/Tfp pilus assembly protein PilF
MTGKHFMGLAALLALSGSIALVTQAPPLAAQTKPATSPIESAAQLVKSGKYAEAIVLYKQIIAQTPDSEQLTKFVALLGLGRIYEDTSDVKNAIATYEQAEKVARNYGDPSTIAAVLNNIGTVYLEQGNYPKANEIFLQGLETSAQLTQRYSEPITQSNLKSRCDAAKAGESSILYRLMRQFCDSPISSTERVKTFNQIRETALKQGQELQTRSLTNLAFLRNRQGNYPEAIRYNQESLALARTIGNVDNEGTNLNNLGTIHVSLGDYPKALDFFEQSLKIHRKINNRSLIARTINNIGQVYAEQGNYRKSIEQYNQSLIIAKEIGDRNHEAVLYNNFGTNYQFQGQYNDAKAMYEKALAIYRETGNRPGEATTLNNLGVFQSTIGDYPAALVSLETSLKNSESLGQRRELAVTYGNLGQWYNDQGRYAQGLDNYQKSLEIQRSIGSRGDEVGGLLSLGFAYGLLGRSAKAEGYCTQGLELAQSLGLRSQEASALGCLAKLKVEFGQTVASQPLLDRALTANRAIGNRRSEVSILRIQAKLDRQSNRLPNAQQSLNEALKITQEIGLKPEEATLLADLGELQMLTQNPQAPQTLQRALSLAETLGDRITQGKALTTLGAAQIAQNPSTAQISLETAVKLWESTRPGLTDADKVSLFEAQEKTYHYLEKALIAQQKIEPALETAERGRARAFIELLASKANAKTSAQTNAQTNAPTIAEIKSIAAAQKATIVQYSLISEQELYIWVIKPNGQVKFASRRLEIPIAQLVLENREVMGVRGRAANLTQSRNDSPINPTTNSQTSSDDRAIDANLRTLNQLLIDPIVADLPTDPEARVILVPHNALFLVPFNALTDTQGKTLIDRHTLTTAPSIQSLTLTRNLKRPTTTAIPLIVGNPKMPIYNNAPLDSLPGAETEAKQIATFFNTQPLIGAQATKSLVLDRMKTATTIHLATHGLLDTLRGEVPGAIALTASPGDDGFLTASEILDLKLSADLVVLSACSTGRGDITGDGVIGLSRSLFVAGVPSVLVSLWNVQDESTALLMTEFYKNLQVAKLPKAKALRQALLTTKQKYPKPSDWAAFNLVGEGD